MALNQVLSVAQMQAAERALIDAGTDVDELMQRAGKGAADWVWQISGGRPVTVLCGPGNNGGDGYVIAAEILRRGGDVCVIAPMPPKTDAAKRAAGLYHGTCVTDPAKAKGSVLVDCLFGSGLSRPLSAEHRALLRRLRVEHSQSVAIDVPSGVNADSGSWPQGMAPWDCTIGLGAWKRAHWSGEAAAKCGVLKLVDIGVIDQSSGEQVAEKPSLTAPAWNDHKYRRGLLAIVPGAMPGASVLAAQAAMGSGAGYVKLLADTAKFQAPADFVVERGPLVDQLSDRRIKVVLVGPGLGRDDAARERLQATLHSGKPTVLDADALHLLDAAFLEGRETDNILLTPHEAELETLCKTFSVVAKTKREQALALHQRTGLTVLAKGPDTLCAHNGGITYLPRGSSWLSVAGSGDVLAGIVASRLSNGAEPASAAVQGVWLHQEAARQAGVAFSASDLAQRVSNAYATFL